MAVAPVKVRWYVPPPGIVATAARIDHGKTRLVGALTGVDTDRLPEKKHFHRDPI